MDYKDAIESVLKADERLWFKNEQKEAELNQTLLIDLAEQYDAKLLSLLFSDEALREKFFVRVGKTHVFKQTDFRFFLEENKIDNSYTQYKNRIGLSDGKRFLKDSHDVVLNFPYKDCVLEGGQSTEEGTDDYFEYDEKVTKTEEKKGYKAHQYNKKQAKRKEIFFNEVLAADEIDRLFDEKALVNWKRFSKEGKIPLLRGGIAKGNDGVENKQREVENIASWQTKSLFPFWQLPKNKHLTQRAKELRQQGILSEVIFWKHFKDKAKLKGFDIDRQVIIGNFIVDFFIAELGFIIEIDGGSHKGKVEYDKEREHHLSSLGLKIIRYTDSEVKNNIDGIYQHLLQSIHERKIFLSTPSNSANLPPLKRGIDGTIKENLIIKGNNLLALHSLKKQFAKKIKLIYIDPPYNTDSDANTFKYNNNFNHSTWLTFMKNRLEVAKSLLKDDGIIIIDIDHFELFYLGVLCDEVFGKTNRLGILAVQHNPGGRDNEFFANSHENKLVYAKNKSLAKIYNFDLSETEKKKFNQEDNISKYCEMGLQRTGDGSKREDRPNLFFPIYYDEKTNEISLIKKARFIKILPIDDSGIERRWRWGKNKIEKEWKTEMVVKKIKGKHKVYTKNRMRGDSGRKPKTFWFDSQYAGTTGTNAIKEIFGDKVFTYPKSPFMIKDTLEIATQKGDIVLDYHLGSGTTAAVAHKMGRQYIGIEQMDYIENIAVERLKKVIAGEQGGISKAVKWTGGGSFIYCELAKWNEKAKEKIKTCKNLDELKEFFSEMVDKYFLNYNLKIKEFQERVVHEDEFKNLSLDEQKQMFATMLDNNQMYVCRSEAEDEKFGLSEADIEMTREFYKK